MLTRLMWPPASAALPYPITVPWSSSEPTSPSSRISSSQGIPTLGQVLPCATHSRFAPENLPQCGLVRCRFSWGLRTHFRRPSEEASTLASFGVTLRARERTLFGAIKPEDPLCYTSKDRETWSFLEHPSKGGQCSNPQTQVERETHWCGYYQCVITSSIYT
jgi:hypothetical protein